MRALQSSVSSFYLVLLYFSCFMHLYLRVHIHLFHLCIEHLIIVIVPAWYKVFYFDTQRTIKRDDMLTCQFWIPFFHLQVHGSNNKEKGPHTPVLQPFVSAFT